jgi:hypothetical protein
VKLDFHDGLVSLSADNAPVRTILAEWARQTGTTIVNGDRVAGAPVTLRIENATERQALDTLLRGVAGYMLAPRRAGTTGTSSFDRIVILPTSVGPRNAPAVATGPTPVPSVANGPRPLVLPRPPIIVAPDEQDDVNNRQDADGPANVPEQAPVRLVQPPGGVLRPGVQTADDAPATEVPETTEAPAAAQPTANNPFGVPAGSSAQPGVIAPPAAGANPAAGPAGR